MAPSAQVHGAADGPQVGGSVWSAVRFGDDMVDVMVLRVRAWSPADDASMDVSVADGLVEPVISFVWPVYGARVSRHEVARCAGDEAADHGVYGTPGHGRVALAFARHPFSVLVRTHVAAR